MSKIIGWFAGPWGYAAVAALAVTLAVPTALYVQGLGYEIKISELEKKHADELTGVANAAAAQMADNIKWMKALSSKLSALDLKAFQEFVNAQNERERLSDDLQSGARKLWVRIRLPSGSDGAGFRSLTIGLDHATALAELDPAFARSLHAIAGDGDSAIAQLNGCQDYAETVSAPRP